VAFLEAYQVASCREAYVLALVVAFQEAFLFPLERHKAWVEQIILFRLVALLEEKDHLHHGLVHLNLRELRS